MKEKVSIIKQDHYGRGIAYYQDKILFIPNALPNEEVLVNHIKEYKKYCIGECFNILKKSPNRAIEKCPYYLSCGGCNIMHQKYEDQLIFKSNKVKEILNKFTNLNIKINPIIPSNSLYNYRNKIVLHSTNGNLGLYKENSNNIINIKECLISSTMINDLIKIINEKIKDKSLLQEVMIRSSSLNEVLLDIKGNISKEDLFKIEYSYLKGIILNNNLIKGRSYIYEEINGYKFKISAPSFFQVNTKMIEVLYNEALRHLQNKEYHNALDLYCGSGTITLLLSKIASKVTGIEVIPSAIANALDNMKINNIENVSFICGKVEDNLDNLNNLDLIVVDPPRSGLDKKVIENIFRLKSDTLIYISCDPVTLARDLNLLKELYDIKEITPVDMFPQTYHVECVSVLHRKSLEK